MANGKKPTKRVKKKNNLKKLSIICATLAALAIGLWFLSGTLEIEKWREFDADKLVNLQQTTLLFDSEEALVASVHGKENRTKVSIENVPLHVKNAFIAAEDVRFYEHAGVDIVRIGGALIADLKSGSLSQGASTITQQLIKLTHLTNEKTFTRKIQEAVLAYQLEKNYKKDQILEMYLNVIYFGRGAYGIEAAAQSYFQKTASELTVVEGAALAAILKAPSNYAPHLKPENNKKRRNMILGTMREINAINEAQAQEAMNTELIIYEKPEVVFPNGWFLDHAISQAEKILSKSGEEFISGGYRIYTTMETSTQNILEQLYEDDTQFPPNSADGTKAESAMSVVDVSTGALRGVIGGREYQVRRGLNRATQARRQPGSAFKPIAVYAPAIDRYDYTPVSFFNDSKTEFEGGYSPRNYGNKYHGMVTLRTALNQSYNVPAVSLLSQIGVSAGRAFALSAGFALEEEDVNLSMALGSLKKGVTPVEMAAGYAMFSNGGNYLEPYAIERITGPDGKVLYQHESKPTRVMQEGSAYLMTSLLSTVITEGTGKNLKTLGIDVAGKTGTVAYKDDGNRDVWMAAYNPQYAVSVWIGYDQTDDAHHLPDEMTGGGAPARLASAFFGAVYPNPEEAPSFQIPDGVVQVDLDKAELIDNHQARLAPPGAPRDRIIREWFLRDNQPTDQSPTWALPEAVYDLMVSEGEDGLPIISFTATNPKVFYRVYRIEGEIAKLVYAQRGPGEVVWQDDTALHGQTYVYYVVGHHVDLEQQGLPYEGPESPHITYEVPPLPEETPIEEETPPLETALPEETIPPPVETETPPEETLPPEEEEPIPTADELTS